MSLENDRALNILYKDDLELYQTLLDNYETLTQEDIDTSFEVSKMAMMLSDRWNEISLELSKRAKELGFTKSDVQNWAYHRYRVCMTIHEHSRVIWRQCKEDFRTRGDEFYGI